MGGWICIQAERKAVGSGVSNEQNSSRLLVLAGVGEWDTGDPNTFREKHKKVGCQIRQPTLQGAS